MTMGRTLARCNYCGRSFCPEEGGPECDCLEAMEDICGCGSGLEKYPLEDARGIFCAYVCTQCEDNVRMKYRPEIFTDPHYECDEPIEEED